MRVPEGPILPHQSFGDPDCCGTLWPLARESDPGVADIICNECDAVVKTVPVGDVERTIREMEFSLDMCNPTCPHCRKENLITGFSEIMAFTCRHCGRLVRLSDDPSVDQIFGPEE
jgi:hypothetical protein